ncbi:type II restriction endonuclease [candidate division KSB1 bacterium]|nr:type II restriction endonuclease [candidate division KSB1 bacterium]
MLTNDFANEFENKVKLLYPAGIEWGIVGILTKNGNVYTLSFDSKILSGIFEIFCEPIIRSIANDQHFIVETSAQNAYPDFTLYHPAEPKQKIAIEVKSTYRQYNLYGALRKFGFTLGSYRSFLRDPDGRKGILYPYSEYSKHWIIGFLYSRNPDCKSTEIRKIIEASSLQTPYTDIEFFVQEKYRIAGKKPGSGNTTNIGSFKSRNLEDFRKGYGGFESQLEFEEYWRNY